MKNLSRILLIGSALALSGAVVAAGPRAAAPSPSQAASAGHGKVASFAPFEQWKTAVLDGDKAALAKLYSTTPLATAQVGDKPRNLDDELQFWAGLRAAGITQLNPKLLEISTKPGLIGLVLRIEGVNKARNTAAGGASASEQNQSVVAGMSQVWTQQADGWRIVATERGEFHPNAVRRLPQPAKPNTSLYPDPSEAQAELDAALAAAAREHKRVLVVFGANWCYDCHVLDTTFRSREFAPLVNANYEVAHISIGEEGKDNAVLAARLGVALDRGIPSLGVLDPDGKVIVAQKNGEFESSVKIGPEDVRAFLEKWKPEKK